MKTLYLIRHAKSSWKDMSLRDRDRPLNKRGKRDAPRMAKFLAEKISCPEVFVSSVSRRTQDTATPFLHTFDRLRTDLEIEEELYHGYEDDFRAVLGRLDNQLNSAMIFAHNPGITDYVNVLTGSDILNILTCGVAGIQLETNDWREINKCPAEMLFYFYPKGLDLHI